MKEAIQYVRYHSIGQTCNSTMPHDRMLLYDYHVNIFSALPNIALA